MRKPLTKQTIHKWTLNLLGYFVLTAYINVTLWAAINHRLNLFLLLGLSGCAFFMWLAERG